MFIPAHQKNGFSRKDKPMLKFLAIVVILALSSSLQAEDRPIVQGTYYHHNRVDGVVHANIRYSFGERRYEEYYREKDRLLRANTSVQRDPHYVRIGDRSRQVVARGVVTRVTTYVPPANHAAPPILGPIAQAFGLVKATSGPATCQGEQPAPQTSLPPSKIIQNSRGEWVQVFQGGGAVRLPNYQP